MFVKKMILLLLIFIGTYASGQNKACNLNDGQLKDVYVFSKLTSHNLTELFGERINPSLVNIIYVKTPENKAQLDAMCNKGTINGIFIFPDKNAAKTIRICNSKDYCDALQRKVELKIEQD